MGIILLTPICKAGFEIFGYDQLSSIKFLEESLSLEVAWQNRYSAKALTRLVLGKSSTSQVA